MGEPLRLEEQHGVTHMAVVVSEEAISKLLYTLHSCVGNIATILPVFIQLNARKPFFPINVKYPVQSWD